MSIQTPAGFARLSLNHGSHRHSKGILLPNVWAGRVPCRYTRLLRPLQYQVGRMGAGNHQGSCYRLARHDRRGTSQHHLRSRAPGYLRLDARGVLSRLQLGAARRELVPAGLGEIGFFTSYEKQGKYVTFFGDSSHYAGNVVKAPPRMATPNPRLPAPDLRGSRPMNSRTRTGLGHVRESLDEQLVAG